MSLREAARMARKIRHAGLVMLAAAGLVAGYLVSGSSARAQEPAAPEPAGGTAVPAAVTRVRTVVPFDLGWLFKYGDVSGAQAPSFADSSWRHVDVPHDWS